MADKNPTVLRDELADATNKWIAASERVEAARTDARYAQSCLNEAETAQMNARLAVDRARDALDRACGYAPPVLSIKLRAGGPPLIGNPGGIPIDVAPEADLAAAVDIASDDAGIDDDLLSQAAMQGVEVIKR